MYKHILLAYDGSEPGQKALLDSVDIAQWSHADLALVAVMPNASSLLVGSMEGGVFVAPETEREREAYQAILDEGVAKMAASGVTAKGVLLVGDTVEEITRYAREIEADLIVVGHKHLDSWAERWWRGSTSPALIEHAPCSVLVAILR
ncbi:MAG: universal stress protein [Gammaproteobacteria bacterium]|jgi:nucleotide-binding universal stress UspA family protein